jgi:hypothetical protein
MIAPASRPLNVKFILPALTEATSPYWRPIKYSLFPPLGLATLAAYLSPDDRAVIVDEHVEPLTLDDTPDLVVIQVYITNAYRAYKIADHYRSKGATALVVEHFRAIVNRGTGGFADELVMRCLVAVLKASPTAYVVNEDGPKVFSQPPPRPLATACNCFNPFRFFSLRPLFAASE